MILPKDLKINVFVYARLSSTRLPKKALLPIIDDKPMLQVVLENITSLNLGLNPIVLTSKEQTDDEIEELVLGLGFDLYRGSLNNVGLRTIEALNLHSCDYFLRVNGDCPIMLKSIMVQGLSFASDNYDIVSNVLQRTYNYGLSFEMIKSTSFIENYNKFNSEQLEHISQYFYNNSDQFSLKSLTAPKDYFSLSSDYPLAVDTEKSYIFVKNLIKRFPNYLELDINALNLELSKLKN